MSLVFHVVAAFVLFAHVPASSLIEASAPAIDDARIEAPARSDAAQCESSMSESPDGSAFESAAPLLRQGYCLDDCSPCETREDCASPQFPNGITCTQIPLC